MISMTDISEFVDKCIEKHGKFLVPILQDIQERFNYLPEEALREVANRLKIPLVDVYGVATFYKSFSFVPKGRHVITVCLGTACHVRGGRRIVDAISRELKINPGETTPDLNFTLETVYCLGCCALGPVVVIDGKYWGHMTPNKVLSIIRRMREEAKQA